VEFVGYGFDVPATNHRDLHGRPLDGAAVIWLGEKGPHDIDSQKYRTILSGRSRRAIEEWRAAAVVGEQSDRDTRRRQNRSNRTPDGPDGQARSIDFVTSERLDKRFTPSITAGDAFFAFVFSHAPVQYDELKRRSDAQEPLPEFRLNDVSITFTVDNQYDLVRDQTLHNVVGIVDGSDAQLKSTYVVVGAHYDHIGSISDEDGNRSNPPGRVSPGTSADRIWNGADDDGSGTVAVMAIARALAAGAKPKRSFLFIWHAGEEIDMYGSRYFADHPSVPIESLVTELNIDMIGRNRNDDPSQANTVLLVGSDRISSELHQIVNEANHNLTVPMVFDYELNDPSDPEEFYYRSDQHSYAAKGVPVIFFTTGLHPDYHANTDEVSKILFDKLTHVTELVYETGMRLANLDHMPLRDHKGARAGKGTK
jgi:hypothetical protein